MSHICTLQLGNSNILIEFVSNNIYMYANYVNMLIIDLLYILIYNYNNSRVS